jgi:hypothetical protein
VNNPRAISAKAIHWFMGARATDAQIGLICVPRPGVTDAIFDRSYSVTSVMFWEREHAP